jgi:hypothetical protein
MFTLPGDGYSQPIPSSPDRKGKNWQRPHGGDDMALRNACSFDIHPNESEALLSGTGFGDHQQRVSLSRPMVGGDVQRRAKCGA